MRNLDLEKNGVSYITEQLSLSFAFRHYIFKDNVKIFS